MSNPLESVSLRKIYKTKGKPNVAINDFNFSVRKDMVFSLLGRNASGKTTFVKVSTTQLSPDAGSVSVYGHDVVEDHDEVRSLISLVPQESRPFPHLTPYEHVYLFQRLNGNTREGSRDRAESMLDLLAMNDFSHSECVNLSGGQKQLTMVAMALSVDTKMYFLDEPTIGLDIITRKRVWGAISRFRAMGKSIILTTHYLDEAAYLSDEICIVSRGNLVKQGSLDELRAALPYDTRVIVRDSIGRSVLEKYGKVSVDNRGTILYTHRENIEDILSNRELNKERLELGPAGLDDVFISLVGEDIGSDEA